MSEPLTPQAIEHYLAGIYEIAGFTLRIQTEERIAAGLTTRDQAVDMFQAIARSTTNAAVRGFYESQAEATRQAGSTPGLRVIPGGKDAATPKPPNQGP